MLSEQFRIATARILGELALLHDRGAGTRYLDKLIRETIFFLFEGGEPEKWAVDRPHSAAARKLHRECLQQGRKFRGSRKGLWQVTYDHAIPLAALRPAILALANEPDQVLRLLDRCICGVIITMEEDNRLCKVYRSATPKGSAFDDLTARYRAVSIEFEPKDLELLKRRFLA